MQKLFVAFTLSTLFFLISCTAPMAIPYERSGKVTCSKYEENVIHIVSEGRAESTGKASNYAERNAFENLLFKGIPASNQESPIVPNESESLRKNGGYFSDLLNNQRYQRFILKSEIAEDVISSKVHFIKQNMSIDLKALRKDLEQNKVIRKFGL
jgi:hypothetical protein